jgi:trehalose 6-phosphate phosphatase
MTVATDRFDDPAAVADDVAGRPGRLFAAFDVDGVLAPIVSHAADAALLPGVLDALIALAALTPVGVVSGRAIENLERFGFPESFLVAGSHGAERRGVPLEPLSALERQRLGRLHFLAGRAAANAGSGAWVETKPTSVVLHVREADAERGELALDELARLAALVSGANVRRGHAVVELATRPATKAAAVGAMRLDLPPGPVLYVGDDITDEEVFSSLTSGDVGVRVGPGATAATRRLRDPQDVLTLVRHLVKLLS